MQMDVPGIARVHTSPQTELMLVAHGVVFGNLGTSPLYTMRECFGGSLPLPPTPDNVLGVLSLVSGPLTLVIAVKYVLFVMRADNHGEEGILAMMALVLRTGAEGPEHRRRLLVIGLSGASLFYGDSMATPAISVLSAVKALASGVVVIIDALRALAPSNRAVHAPHTTAKSGALLFSPTNVLVEVEGSLISQWLKRLGLLAIVVLLPSCYIPDKFKSELRLSRYGDYSLTFKGDLLWAPILDDYRKGKVTIENEQEKLENIRKDLIRDNAVRKMEPRGRGRFAIEYERDGRLGKVQLVALLRRDARLIALRSKENGLIAIHANSLKPSDTQIMAEMGLNMEGEFRITTDANVVENNATEVRLFGVYKVYIWKIENPLSPMPHLVMLRDDDPERPLSPRVSELP